MYYDNEEISGKNTWNPAVWFRVSFLHFNMIHVRILWKSKKNEDTHYSLSGANPSRMVINLTGANLINSIFFTYGYKIVKQQQKIQLPLMVLLWSDFE